MGVKLSGFPFAASLVGSLAWPLITIVAALLFRSELKMIFGHFGERLKRLKSFSGPAGLGAQFEDALFEVKREAAEISNTTSMITGVVDLPGMFEAATGGYDQFKRANSSPRAAIIESWIAVEHAMQRWYLNSFPADKGKYRSSNSMIKALEDPSIGGPISNFSGVLSDLMRLRDQAAHEREFEATSLAAYEYARTAYEIAGMMNIILNSNGEDK